MYIMACENINTTMWLLLMVFRLSCISFCLGQVDKNEDNSHLTPQCFHQPVEACPVGSCRCKTVSDELNVLCCNINQQSLLSEEISCAKVSRNFTNLHIRNATWNTLNLAHALFRQLKSLSITNGKIKEVTGEFGKFTSISCLNLSSNSISKFPNRSLAFLHNITVIDISYNNLSDIPRFRKDFNVSLDISGTKILCDNVLEAMKSTNLHFLNKNKSSCLSPWTFQWFNSTEYIPIYQIEKMQEVHNKGCIKNCSCEPARMLKFEEEGPVYEVTVDCSQRGLTSLPANLPPYTIGLNVSFNNISSLEPLLDDPTYQNLRKLIADNNQITSILPLEGTKFINHLVILSLKNNKLKFLPMYILSKIFDRTDYTQYINFGQNDLQCDCNTAKVLKTWLISKQKYIRDFDEIYCDHSKLKVVDLDPAQLCQSPEDWTDYIYYIITAEVLLLVLLVAKVSYDYWVFKTAGYLPWPASKMPKLPCDWLCE